MLDNSWKIGKVVIPNKIVLAPMAGISNKVFRLLAKKFGAGLSVAEMISDQGIHFRNEKTLQMLQIDEHEHPVSVQIFGGKKQSLVEAACFIAENTTADIIDINMGCPVKKVLKANAGAKWLLDCEQIYHTLRAIVNAIDKPVTVKMRIGWDSKHLNAVENALAAQSAGVKAIAMHGRTREQMYKGCANWEILREVAQKLTIPFVGNGDIKTPQDAKKMLEDIGATAVMIGRAAIGNPWVLQRIAHFLETGQLIDEPDATQKIKLAKAHLTELVALKGEKIGVCEFRHLAAYYLKSFPNAAKIKAKIYELTNVAEINSLLTSLLIRNGC